MLHGTCHALRRKAASGYLHVDRNKFELFGDQPLPLMQKCLVDGIEMCEFAPDLCVQMYCYDCEWLFVYITLLQTSEHVKPRLRRHAISQWPHHYASSGGACIGDRDARVVIDLSSSLDTIGISLGYSFPLTRKVRTVPVGATSMLHAIAFMLDMMAQPHCEYFYIVIQVRCYDYAPDSNGQCFALQQLYDHCLSKLQDITQWPIMIYVMDYNSQNVGTRHTIDPDEISRLLYKYNFITSANRLEWASEIECTYCGD